MELCVIFTSTLRGLEWTPGSTSPPFLWDLDPPHSCEPVSEALFVLSGPALGSYVMELGVGT